MTAILLCSLQSAAQTTFTESAVAYGLNLNQNKDGGHAWSDFDGDGDIDVLVLENSGSARSFLMQNNGAGTFTNVQATLAPGMLSAPAERQAAWGDLNNDGRPDFMIISHGNSSSNPALQIFLQNASGTFGDGVGGTAPITVGRSGYTININPINAEGAGFFDFEGDGDLDIFFDSHNYGIELLRNNYINHTTHTIVNPPAASLFTHITTGNGSGVVQFGLNQFATDGDYGTAADVDDDGWVDIFMRKRDENDFFLNQGGTFTSGSDLAQAANGNKGGNGLWDLDNDGDLDAVWTENGLTQIFRNDGPGIWTALGGGVFPGLPQPSNTDNGSSSNDIDALAGGDIDNDGDIDIILVGDTRSYLYINQLNSPTPAPGVVGSGAAMTFALDTQTFNTRNGEGTTMVDVDDDGDLDIYMNISHSSGNQLWINNLPAANRNNHLMVNVTEDRAPDGSTGGFSGRIALGTNVLIRDCDGNIVSGLRQVNGVFGHGTQQPELVHFGLPLGESQTYLIEVHYPNFYDPVNGISRLIATGIAQPGLIPGTNHYTLTTTDAESLENPNAPVANDDLEIVTLGTSISVQISLFDNDTEPDGDNFAIESVVQPAIGSVVIDDADLGLVTYTYSAAVPFPGTTFDYTITDSADTLCPSAGKSDTATVTVYEPCADPGGIDSDGDGINDICDEDDDNDGILDSVESPRTVLWVTNGTPGSEEQNTIDKLIALGYTVTVVDDNVASDADNYDVTFIFEDVFSGDAYANVANMTTTTKGVITSEPALHDEILGAATGGNSVNAFIDIIDNAHFITTGLSLGNYDIADAEYYGTSLTSGTELGRHPNGEGSVVIWEKGEAMEVGIAPGRRAIVPHTNGNGGFNSDGEDLLVNAIIWTSRTDTDLDGVDDYLDLDSDNDGIYDAVEAGHDQSHTNGRLTAAVGLDGVGDNVQNSGQEDSGTVNYTLQDSDSDTNHDFVELDSDNDGCEDVLEAGYTENSGATGELQGTGYHATTGLVTGNIDGYTPPLDGDTNTVFDFREAGNAPTITTQPPDTQTCPGCDTAITVVASNTDTYQWQIFNGSIWVDLSDSGIHGGTNTSTLTITNASTSDNGNQYRVIISNSSYICTTETSNVATLTVRVNTVITNRKITYRVNKN
ncbi:MAG: FG-GAP-like repeat-containing protein [Flavobacteriaceae bacterium]